MEKELNFNILKEIVPLILEHYLSDDTKIEDEKMNNNIFNNLNKPSELIKNNKTKKNIINNFS